MNRHEHCREGSNGAKGFVSALGAGLILAPTLAAVCAESDGAQTGALAGPIEEVVVVGTRRAGLAADHTLVMVNGKRRHRGAVIAWLVPKASEGAQGPDLSVIPGIAVERVEVLADGASAQYGSDAVAGVMNFVLKSARGETPGGLSWDVSAGTGASDVEFFINNTVNAALGPANPPDFRFDLGDYAQKETGVNLDMAYVLDLAPFASATHLAFGAEWWVEQFRIQGGEPASWARTFSRNGVAVDLQSQGFTAASNGFPGFSPDTAGAWRQSNSAVYADLETDVRDNWAIGVAVRSEEHQDFGATTNGKLSSRLELGRGLALPGTLSTGFRVPTPGQSNAINATSKIGGEGAERQLSIVATIAPTSTVGLALGGAALKPERSVNASAGLVFASERATAKLDCFRIRVRDRLALSRDIELNRPDLGAGRVREDLIGQLERGGLTSARSWNYIKYFTNDFTTLTSGCEASGRYRVTALGGVTTLSGIFNAIRTRVEHFTAGGPLDDAREIRDHEAGLPQTRYLLSVTHGRGRFDFSARYSRHGG